METKEIKPTTKPGTGHTAPVKQADIKQTVPENPSVVNPSPQGVPRSGSPGVDDSAKTAGTGENVKTAINISPSQSGTGIVGDQPDKVAAKGNHPKLGDVIVGRSRGNDLVVGTVARIDEANKTYVVDPLPLGNSNTIPFGNKWTGVSTVAPEIKLEQKKDEPGTRTFGS